MKHYTYLFYKIYFTITIQYPRFKHVLLKLKGSTVCPIIFNPFLITDTMSTESVSMYIQVLQRLLPTLPPARLSDDDEDDSDDEMEVDCDVRISLSV